MTASKQAIAGQYWYDGDGKRVKKYVPAVGENPAEITIFVYDAGGKLVAEYSTIVASTIDAKVAYLTNDHLGSPRINTDRDGNVISRHDYLPFGEEVFTAERVSGLSYDGDTIRKQFTGYERDTETDLDFAQARMYAKRLGRFTTPDDFLNDSNLSDPQSWGKFVYVRNNPTNLTDPTGQCTPTIGNPCIRPPTISGPNMVPKQPNRELVPNVGTLGYKVTASGGYVLMNVRSDFAEGDRIADYKHLRAAILPGGEIRRGSGSGPDAENPDSSQMVVEGNSRFVTDTPGASVAPRAVLTDQTAAYLFVAGEYNTKTKTLGENVAYYLVAVTFGKGGEVDPEKSMVVPLTKEQFVEMAQSEQWKAKIPKNKNKEDAPEELLKP